MEQPLLILLGALLAIGGGFISQHNQSRLDQRRQDRELFHQSEEILIEMQPYLEEVMTPPSKELHELSKKLRYLGYRPPAPEAINFTLQVVR